MKCPKCYALKLSVLRTRVQDSGIIVRRRNCDECGFRFNTHELPPGAYSYARYDIERWIERQTGERNTLIAQRKRLAAQMRALRAQGLLAKEVAEKFGMSVHMVWYYTRPATRKGTDARQKTKAANAGRSRKKADRGDVVALRSGRRKIVAASTQSAAKTE